MATVGTFFMSLGFCTEEESEWKLGKSAMKPALSNRNILHGYYDSDTSMSIDVIFVQ